MTDSVAPVDIFHTILCCKCISDPEMSCVIHLTGRDQMIVDQYHLIRIPKLLKSHFFKFFRHKRNKDIMDHNPVHIYGYNVSRFYFTAQIAAYDFFNDSLSHSC